MLQILVNFIFLYCLCLQILDLDFGFSLSTNQGKNEFFIFYLITLKVIDFDNVRIDKSKA